MIQIEMFQFYLSIPLPLNIIEPEKTVGLNQDSRIHSTDFSKKDFHTYLENLVYHFFRQLDCWF